MISKRIILWELIRLYISFVSINFSGVVRKKNTTFSIFSFAFLTRYLILYTRYYISAIDRKNIFVILLINKYDKNSKD